MTMYITIQGDNEDDFSEFYISDKDMPEIREMLMKKDISTARMEAAAEDMSNDISDEGFASAPDYFSDGHNMFDKLYSDR